MGGMFGLVGRPRKAVMLDLCVHTLRARRCVLGRVGSARVQAVVHGLQCFFIVWCPSWLCGHFFRVWFSLGRTWGVGGGRGGSLPLMQRMV